MASEAQLRAEIQRLEKIILALMNRAERSTCLHNSDFNLLQSSVLLEELVLNRTQALEAALAENQKITHALWETENKFHSVLDQSLVGITLLVEGRFNYANPKFAEIFGYSSEVLMHLGVLDITPENNRQFVVNIFKQALDNETEQLNLNIEALRKDGNLITVEISASAPIEIGGKSALIVVWADISERVRAEREVNALQNELREQAMRDPLTGLYNRLYLNVSLERELGLATRHDYPLSVVMADLDFFKTINDTYGHLAGDQALKVFAELMKHSSRSTDINCRYGGEEFFLVLPSLNLEKACERAELLRIAVASTPVAFAEHHISLSASFGIASFPEHGLTANALLNAADKALYAAKNAGRNRVTYL
jgi:diguanylate cyclase (GGDEF)-like protein/PAS domain S-box-containing protein